MKQGISCGMMSMFRFLVLAIVPLASCTLLGASRAGSRVGVRPPRTDRLRDLLAWTESMRTEVAAAQASLATSKTRILSLEGYVSGVAFNLTEASQHLATADAAANGNSMRLVPLEHKEHELGEKLTALTDHTASLQSQVANASLVAAAVTTDLGANMTALEEKMEELAVPNGTVARSIDHLAANMHAYQLNVQAQVTGAVRQHLRGHIDDLRIAFHNLSDATVPITTPAPCDPLC